MLFLSFQIFQDLYDDTVFSFKYFKACLLKKDYTYFLEILKEKLGKLVKIVWRQVMDFPILKGEN